MIPKTTSDAVAALTLRQLPTTTVHQSRLQIFSPTRRPSDAKREIITPWGTATVTGKLGQAHADFVEAILKHARDWRSSDTGQIQILVDPYVVRTTIGGGSKASYEQMWRVAQDVMRALIDLKTSSLRVVGHIIDNIEESNARVPNPLNRGERALWRVTFAPAFVHLLGGDLHLHYDPKEIAMLTTGIAQAVARHVATHSREPRGGWHIDGLILIVGAGGSSQTLRDRRRELRRDSLGLLKLGLLLEGGRLRRCDAAVGGPQTNVTFNADQVMAATLPRR